MLPDVSNPLLTPALTYCQFQTLGTKFKKNQFVEVFCQEHTFKIISAVFWSLCSGLNGLLHFLSNSNLPSVFAH